MRRIYLGIAAATTALLLTGCGSDDSDTDTAGNTTPTTAAAPASSPPELTAEQRASIMAEVGYPPEADAATEAAYVAALDKIDRDIAHGKADKAVSRGRDTCRSIKDHPGNRAKQVEVTQQRWISPTHPEGRTASVAARILDATHEHLCPTF
ncbi:hypothetical protein OG216_25895 [Streptomycetaceae bacterium NBC_01309]